MNRAAEADSCLLVSRSRLTLLPSEVDKVIPPEIQQRPGGRYVTVTGNSLEIYQTERKEYARRRQVLRVVARRICRLPAPRVGAHFVDAKSRLPAEKISRKTWVSVQHCYIAFPARCKLVRQLAAARL